MENVYSLSLIVIILVVLLGVVLENTFSVGKAKTR
jgi:hypothetical protein